MKLLKYFSTALLMSIFVFTGCGQKKPLPYNENYEPWMDRFFEYLLFSQQGAYTLHGSKPMSYIEICLYTPQELMEIRKELGIEPNAQNASSTPVMDLMPVIEGWDHWQRLKNKLQFPRFIIFSKQDQGHSKLHHMYFINILETALAITENYSLFRSILGFDFDPLKVVFEVEDENSQFWQCVFSRSDLIGILYGYGLKNSQCFSWMFGLSSSDDFDVPDSLKNALSKSRVFSSDGMFTGKEAAKDLSIPTFRSFQDNDPYIQKYEEERKKIQSLYRGKNTGVVALETLLH